MRLIAGLGMAFGLAQEAGAVFTFTSVAVPARQITLRVGTDASGTVDNVIFNVPGNSVGAGAVAGAPTILVVMTVRKPLTTPSAAAPQTLTVDSSAGLSCQSGGCGSTVIPFNTIGWVSTVVETGTYAGWDVPSGTFTGASNQSLINKSVNAGFQGVMTITNTLAFTYNNSTIYPSGVYSGRVVFTATSL